MLLIDFDPQANLSEYLKYEPDGNPTMTQLIMMSLCRKAGALTMGFDAVEDAVVKGKAWLVMTASDASPKTVQRLNYAVGDMVDEMCIRDRCRRGRGASGPAAGHRRGRTEHRRSGAGSCLNSKVLLTVSVRFSKSIASQVNPIISPVRKPVSRIRAYWL